MKLEGNLGGRRRQPSAWIRGGLAALAMAVTCYGWGAEGLRQRLPVQQVVVKLMDAAQQGDLRQMKAAVAEGANVNCRGTNGLTPLLQAIAGSTAPLDAQRRECVAFLVEHGAEVDARDSDGRTPLIHATLLGDLETVRLLVKAGAWIMLRDRFHKTAQLYAAEGHREILIYLGSTLKAQRGAAW